MRDLRRYWREVREIEAGIAEFVWIAGGDGAVTEAAARVAAPLLHAKSHRLATEEEIAARKQRDRSAIREAAERELRRRGVAVVAIPGDTLKK